MLNDFKLLWFEDEFEFYDDIKPKIEKYLSDEYSLILEAPRRLGNEPLDDLKKYDLIILDYKLFGTELGTNKYKPIRDAYPFIDMLYYSSQYGSLRSSLQGLGLTEGTYSCHANELENKLKGLIDKIVRRSESIENLRGMVMESTSDYDIRIKAIINQSIESGKVSKSDLNLKIKTLFKDHSDVTLQRYSDLQDNPDQWQYIIQNPRVIESYTQSRLLNFVIEKSSFKLDKCSRFHDEYDKEIIAYRNALAHAKLEDSKIVVRGAEIQIDSTLHKLMRTTVNKFNIELKNLENQVK